jgi:hypothetical protein
MRNTKVVLVFAVCFVFVFFSSFSMSFADDCSYESVHGRCKIESAMIKDVKDGDSRREVLEVVFYFTPDSEVNRDVGIVQNLKSFTGERKIELLPRGTDVKLLGLTAGAVLRCEYSIAKTSGCKPRNFRFLGPETDWTD